MKNSRIEILGHNYNLPVCMQMYFKRTQRGVEDWGPPGRAQPVSHVYLPFEYFNWVAYCSLTGGEEQKHEAPVLEKWASLDSHKAAWKTGGIRVEGGSDGPPCTPEVTSEPPGIGWNPASHARVQHSSRYMKTPNTVHRWVQQYITWALETGILTAEDG